MLRLSSSITRAYKSLGRRQLIGIAIILLLGFLAYSNTFEVPFTFDDTDNIEENVFIRDASNIPAFFVGLDVPFASRPLMYATYAVNYSLGGLDTTGYHIFNLALHLLNGVLLYFLVSLTGKYIGFEENTFTGAALLSAGVFILHPVMTETVTNVVNRSMLLASTFYFLGMILFLKAVTAQRRQGIYIVGLLITSLLGMGSRENFATFPLMLALYDYCFISKSDIKRMTRHFKAYLPVFLSLGYMAYLIITNTYSKSNVPGGVPHLQYAITEFNVYWTYVRLLLFPVNLTLDYDYPIARTLFTPSAALALLGYLGCWIAGIALIKRTPLLSFLVLWLLVILFPISFGVTIMDLRLDDVIFEHRLYLPGTGVIVAAAAGVFILTKNRLVMSRGLKLMFGLVLIILSVATYTRNATWSNQETLWEDTLKKSPLKARVWYNLGVELASLERREEALADFNRAIELKPDYSDAWNNRGAVLTDLGRHDEAIAAFDKVLEINPHYEKAWYSWYNKGLSLSALGRTDEALLAFAMANESNPDFAEGLNKVGIELGSLGKYDEALSVFERSIELDPNDAESWYLKGLGLGKMGRYDESVAALERATQLRSDYALAWNSMGIGLGALGKYNDALNAFQKALELDPNNVEAMEYRDRALAIINSN